MRYAEDGDQRSVHVALIAAPVSGCGALTSTKNSGVANPLTPAQSNAQVVDAAQYQYSDAVVT
jgi:hypothetical protein